MFQIIYFRLFVVLMWQNLHGLLRSAVWIRDRYLSQITVISSFFHSRCLSSETQHPRIHSAHRGLQLHCACASSTAPARGKQTAVLPKTNARRTPWYWTPLVFERIIKRCQAVIEHPWNGKFISSNYQFFLSGISRHLIHVIVFLWLSGRALR